ncbi:MAG: hypothetical protein A2170_14525 [Deltaproteobacteria bacterium RBG_13_53_10]|nr:MAG: hypothetical protein A2170_14525 [Deltaproteobacteria bacterium RBG_13_53_10]
MKVLIIEQEKTIRQSLLHFLERFESYEVFAARSEKEGMTLLETIPFDLILCEHRLPDGNGLEVLKTWAGKSRKTISILMTVYDDERLRQEALNAGVQGYLVKPFDLKQLEEAMDLGNAP